MFLFYIYFFFKNSKYCVFIISFSSLNQFTQRYAVKFIYSQYVTALFASVWVTSLLKPLQINTILLQTEVLQLVLNGNSDEAVDKYFFPDCLEPFFPGYHLRYQMTFPALSFFFSFSPRRLERCKGALPAAGNQFIQSRVACRERWDRAGLI